MDDGQKCHCIAAMFAAASVLIIYTMVVLLKTQKTLFALERLSRGLTIVKRRTAPVVTPMI